MVTEFHDFQSKKVDFCQRPKKYTFCGTSKKVDFFLVAKKVDHAKVYFFGLPATNQQKWVNVFIAN